MQCRQGEDPFSLPQVDWSAGRPQATGIANDDLRTPFRRFAVFAQGRQLWSREPIPKWLGSQRYRESTAEARRARRGGDGSGPDRGCFHPPQYCYEGRASRSRQEGEKASELSGLVLHAQVLRLAQPRSATEPLRSSCLCGESLWALSKIGPGIRERLDGGCMPLTQKGDFI